MSYQVLGDDRRRDRHVESKSESPYTLGWDVSFSIPRQQKAVSSSTGLFTMGKKKKGPQLVVPDEVPMIEILKGVKGVVTPGQLFAVMGPSGSGKTSLLNCLSLRNPHFTGKVLYGGVQMDKDTASQLCGFVQQQDMLMATLTSLETLEFYSSLSPRGGSREASEHMMDILGLRKISNVLVGGEGSFIKGISGGERKRLAIAVEMLSDPPILFLDEPTSGLDAYMAEAVVYMLKELAITDSKVVVATIHQPSSAVFDAFSSCMLLGEGRTAYFGSLGAAVTYFSRQGYSCPQYHNPADFFIKLISDSTMSRNLNKRGTLALTGNLESIAEAWHVSPEAESVATEVEALQSDGFSVRSGLLEHDSIGEGGSLKRAGFWRQFQLLLKRNGTMIKRDMLLTYARLVQSILGGLAIGIVFLQILDRPVNDKHVNTMVGCLVFLPANHALGGVIGLLAAYPREAVVMSKEYSDGLYSIGPYFLARTIVELPSQVVFPLLEFFCAYFIVGFPVDMNMFWEGYASYVTLILAAFSFGYLPGSAFTDPTMAVTSANFYIIFFFLLCGYLVNINDIPAVYYPFEYMSYYRYGFESMMIAYWRRIDVIECSNGDDCSYSSGRDVLDDYNFRHSLEAFWFCIAMNLVLFVAYRIAAVYVLQWRVDRDVKRAAGYV